MGQALYMQNCFIYAELSLILYIINWSYFLGLEMDLNLKTKRCFRAQVD